MKKYILFYCSLVIYTSLFAQNITINGVVTSNNLPVPYASILVLENALGTQANENGDYTITLPVNNLNTITVQFQSQGYKTQEQKLNIEDKENYTLNVNLNEDYLGLETVVVSATRNRISKKEAPVIVNVVGPKLLKATQSLTLADGLNFQPGVRVETNCQNCGFTQVRLNGLEGQYTQILVNNRPIFSALNSVYGLEQIPVSVIERIEVVRSGGSALFGSNAIAGTLNVITKEPLNDNWEVGGTLALINGTSVDRNTNVNATMVSEDLKSGITLYGMYRNRDPFDANNDGFTEITELQNNTLGTNVFFKPNDNSKIGLDFTAINDYRRGGDRLDLAPQFTDITEELDHNTIFSGVNYEWFDDARQNNFSTYVSVQNTTRDSYYGGLGGGRTRLDSITANNAFGITKDLALVGGIKYTREFKNKETLTTGVEYQLNDTQDIINGYNKLIDQTVNSAGWYAQYEWKPTQKFTTLFGARLDYINVNGFYTLQNIERTADFDQFVLNPRLTLLYNLTKEIQLRGGYARGFRAPQAFNEDLHISSVGGEQRFVIISENLESEFSNAYTASFNYTKEINKVQTNFLAEGFYTTLDNPFTIVSTGTSLPNGSILEETRNGTGAYVAGVNIEATVSPNPKWFFQAGATLQRATYNEPQILFETDGTISGEDNVVVNNFVRTPEWYGFLNTNFTPNSKFKIDVTGSFTGNMIVPRVVGDNGFIELEESPTFVDVTTKVTYTIAVSENFKVELNTGVQNMFNSYQNDFDQGPLRDSDYIYGPNRPRTYFFGLRIGNF